MKIKEPNVADAFYPGDSKELIELLDRCFEQANLVTQVKNIKALVAPHAGYVYSGPVAATAYQQLASIKKQIKTVVVLSPSHYHGFKGVAVSDATYFQTPLGAIEVNQDLQHKIIQLEQVKLEPIAFEKEHALEVHLPFLQRVLDDFKLVPLMVGYSSPTEIKDVIECLAGDGIFFVVSSDLSHFHDYETCNALDKRTTQLIENKDVNNIGDRDACGYYPLRGMLLWAKEHNYQVKNIDHRNSGDMSGDKSRVVGYGSYLVY